MGENKNSRKKRVRWGETFTIKVRTVPEYLEAQDKLNEETL
jgi:hypothetical protein